MYDIIIIGAGITGSMLARTLSRYELKVLVLEKNIEVGAETTAANSAIVHSGYDPLPGSLKAKLNVEGNKMYDQVCEDLDVPFRRIGSMTLAFSQEEDQKLLELQKRASENGVETVILNHEETLKAEPNVSPKVTSSLLAPTAGIINPFRLVTSAMENAIDNGVELKEEYEVKTIKKVEDHFLINDELEAKVVINCAGIYSGHINELINERTFEIIPRKGEYFVLQHFDNNFVKHTLFMLPSEKGKGVLVSPTTSFNYLVGPSAEKVLEGDKSTDKATLNDVKAQAKTMIENIPYQNVIRTFAGIRATPSIHDFIIEESKTEGFINVAGIESPGLASSPAIAKKVVDDILSMKFNLVEKSNYNPKVRKHIKVNGLSLEEKKKLFAENPKYANMVCKCEQVSEAEILDMLNRSCPPKTINGLRRRLRVGFGLCQGGMCQGDALKLMADFYHVDPMEIRYDTPSSYILLKHTKEGN